MTITSVEVIEPIGGLTSPRCTIDEFTEGELTVSSIDDGTVIRVFPPGTWRHAYVYDDLGYPVMSFSAKGGRHDTARA